MMIPGFAASYTLTFPSKLLTDMPSHRNLPWIRLRTLNKAMRVALLFWFVCYCRQLIADEQYSVLMVPGEEFCQLLLEIPESLRQSIPENSTWPVTHQLIDRFDEALVNWQNNTGSGGRVLLRVLVLSVPPGALLTAGDYFIDGGERLAQVISSLSGLGFSFLSIAEPVLGAGNRLPSIRLPLSGLSFTRSPVDPHLTAGEQAFTEPLRQFYLFTMATRYLQILYNSQYSPKFQMARDGIFPGLLLITLVQKLRLGNRADFDTRQLAKSSGLIFATASVVSLVKPSGDEQLFCDAVRSALGIAVASQSTMGKALLLTGGKVTANLVCSNCRTTVTGIIPLLVVGISSVICHSTAPCSVISPVTFLKTGVVIADLAEATANRQWEYAVIPLVCMGFSLSGRSHWNTYGTILLLIVTILNYSYEYFSP